MKSIPSWVKPTIARLVDVQRLPENWDSYGSHPIKAELIKNALGVLGATMSQNIPAPAVVPLADGGLQLEWHRRQQDLEIVFSADEPAQFFYRNRATDQQDEGLARETNKLASLLLNLV